MTAGRGGSPSWYRGSNRNRFESPDVPPRLKNALNMVRARGLEPPILSEPDPKSGASAIPPPFEDFQPHDKKRTADSGYGNLSCQLQDDWLCPREGIA
jgi:hypothetical protein